MYIITNYSFYSNLFSILTSDLAVTAKRHLLTNLTVNITNQTARFCTILTLTFTGI